MSSATGMPPLRPDLRAVLAEGPKRSVRSVEHDEQAALFRMVNASTLPGLALLYAIPNGGHRSKATAGKLKAEGVRRGVLDLCLPVSRAGSGAHGDTVSFHGLYLELKASYPAADPHVPGRGRMEHGRPSSEQIEWARALIREGYAVAFAWSAAAAFQILVEYLGARFRQVPEPWRRESTRTIGIVPTPAREVAP